MANSRDIKRNISRLRRLKTWQLFVLLLLAGFISATFLRLNNIGMVQRRDAVLSADKTADATNTQLRLYDLQRYVATHMNSDMGVIYLEGQYHRDTQKLIDAAANDDNPNGNVHKKAQDICHPRYENLGHYSQAYQQCVISELNSFAPAGSPDSTIKLPKPDQYRQSFISPLWSPDFAGFSVLICLLIAMVIVARLFGLILLRVMLKMQHKGL